MVENSTQLQEVEIAFGERLDENIEKTNMSQVKLKIQNVKTIPAILGEVDVLKTQHNYYLGFLMEEKEILDYMLEEEVQIKI